MNKVRWGIGLCVLAAGSGWWAWRTWTPDAPPTTPPQAVITAPAPATAPPSSRAPTPTPEGLSLAARLRDALDHGDSIATLLKDWLPHAGEDPKLSTSLAFEALRCTRLFSEEEQFIEHGAARMSTTDRDEKARNLNLRASRCSDVGPEEWEQLRYDLATVAANGGDRTAQLGYRLLAAPYINSERSMVRDGIRETYKRDVVRFAQAALSIPDREAYHGAYVVYSTELYGAHDPVMAYAYLLKSTEEFTPEGAEEILTEASASLGMTTEQLARAQRLANQLPLAPDPERHF